jgi:hypothetical protein
MNFAGYQYYFNRIQYDDEFGDYRVAAEESDESDEYDESEDDINPF